MAQEASTIQCRVEKQLVLNYLRYLPPEYGSQPGKKWPLILFLHGAGERGNNLDLVKVHGIARVVGERDLPFATLSPQCPVNHWWSEYLPVLDALLTEAVETLNVDPQRIYLTGLSMGGFGTYHMAAEYPDRFAAIAPICGAGPWMFGFPDRATEIKHIPAWIFHGALDEAVPVAASEVMAERLRKLGADVRLTIYPDLYHDSWTVTYNNPALYDWFLEHKRAG